MEKITKLQFGNYRCDKKVGIPVVEILDAEGEPVGYLSAFRGYSFQVSGDFEGRGDYGSTPVFGLGNLTNTAAAEADDWMYRSNLGDEGRAKFLIDASARYAVQRFAEIRSRKGDVVVIPPRIEIGWHFEERQPGFYKFIEATYHMLVSGNVLKGEDWITE